MATHANTSSRRSFLAAAALAPVAISVPALARSPDPVDRYYAATDAYNGGAAGMTDDDYTQAVDDLDAWEPPTQRDFLRKFIAQYEDGGAPREEYRMLLVRQAKRLLV